MNDRRSIDDIEFIICQTQGDIYEYIAEKGYDMEIFSDLYMKSAWCKRYMDTTYSRFQVREPRECLDFILPEIKEKLMMLPDNKIFDKDIAFWIGYTYRQLYIETGVDSHILMQKIPFSLMCTYYPGMHTVNEDYAIFDIASRAGLKLKKEFYGPDLEIPSFEL